MDGNMYNLVFGMNPYVASILMTIGVEPTSAAVAAEFDRFRDIFIVRNPETQKLEVAVYTRNTVGNPTVASQRKDYLRYTPDSFDSTYGTVFLSIGDDWQAMAEQLLHMQMSATGIGEEWNPDKRWTTSIDDMSNMSINEATHDV